MPESSRRTLRHLGQLPDAHPGQPFLVSDRGRAQEVGHGSSAGSRTRGLARGGGGGPRWVSRRVGRRPRLGGRVRPAVFGTGRPRAAGCPRAGAAGRTTTCGSGACSTPRASRSTGWSLADVSFVRIDAWGAGGGVPVVGPPQSRATGGRGAGISATVDVVGGETLTIAVGARGRATRDDGAPADGAGRRVVGAPVGTRRWRTSPADGSWPGAGAAPSPAAEGRGWFGVGGAPGSASIRSDRERFGARIDPLAKVGDGRLRLVYDQFDRDGPPSVVVRPVRVARAPRAPPLHGGVQRAGDRVHR